MTVFLGPSHFVLAINPEFFVGNLEAFETMMTEYIEGIRYDAGLRIPGDNAHEVEGIRRKAGVPIDDSLKLEIGQWCEKAGYAVDWE